MTWLVFLALFEFNKLEFDYKLNEYLGRLHTRHNLRLEVSDEKFTIEGFIKEYGEAYSNNYPQLSDAYNFGFPCRDCTKHIINFNLRYQSHCVIKTTYGREEDINWWANALKEARDLYIIYDELDNALYDHYALIHRRRALHKLRMLIGEKDFYRGVLPPPVPLHRFEFFD